MNGINAMDRSMRMKGISIHGFGSIGMLEMEAASRITVGL